MEAKSFLVSKTIILNLIIAVVGLLAAFNVIPSVKEYVDAHNDLILTSLGILGVGLRLITKDKIQIS